MVLFFFALLLMMLLCGSQVPSSLDPIVVIHMLVLLFCVSVDLVSLVSLVFPPSCPMHVGAWNTKMATNHEVIFFAFFALVFF
jgi:hypothetical protein